MTTLRDTLKWVQEVDVADDEVAPKKYDQAARSEQWRDSVLGERTALKNRGYWRVVSKPKGVKLIKLKITRFISNLVKQLFVSGGQTRCWK